MEDTTYNIYPMKSKGIKTVIKTYLVLTKPAHKLTDVLIDVVTEFVVEYISIQKKVLDIELINTLLFSTKTKKKIRNNLGLDTIRFNNILSILRKQSIIINNELNTKIIPNLSFDTKEYKLIFQFMIDEK